MPLPNLPIDLTHPEVAKWISGETVVAEGYSEKSDALLVVTRRDDEYSLIRAFHIGGKVAVSSDAQNVSADNLIGRLIDRLAER